MCGLFTGISICHWHMPSSENLSNECRKSPLALMGMCVPLNDGFHNIKRSFVFLQTCSIFYCICDFNVTALWHNRLQYSYILQIGITLL